MSIPSNTFVGLELVGFGHGLPGLGVVGSSLENARASPGGQRAQVAT